MTNVILDQKAVAVMQEVIGGGSGSGIAIVNVSGKYFDTEAFLATLIAKGVDVDDENYSGEFKLGISYTSEETYNAIEIKKDSDAYLLNAFGENISRFTPEGEGIYNLRDILTESTIKVAFASATLAAYDVICTSYLVHTPTGELLTFTEDEIESVFVAQNNA